MVTAWVNTGGTAQKIAHVKASNSRLYVWAISAVFAAIVLSYLTTSGHLPYRFRPTTVADKEHGPANWELKVTDGESKCENCAEVPLDPTVSTPTDEEFENDEEIKNIKKQMREDVESQATELGPSAFISSAEWKSQAFKDADKLQDRVKGALMGAYLADAASLGLQGAQGPEHVQKLVEGRKGKVPEFFRPPITPYEAASGSFSAWGYEALPLLQSLLSANKMDGYQFSIVTLDYFGKYPGYVNEVPKAVIARLKAGKAWPYCGVDLDTASSLVKVPVVLARYAGTPDVSSMVEDGVRVHQSNEEALSAAQAFAAILERVIVLNATVKEAAEWAVHPDHLDAKGRDRVKDVLDHVDLDILGAVARWGTGSRSGQVLQLALYVALSKDDYKEAVRLNMLAGGDVTARAHVVGALMGARHGYTSVPKRWRKKSNRRLELEQMVQMLTFQRTAHLPVALGGGQG